MNARWYKTKSGFVKASEVIERYDLVLKSIEDDHSKYDYAIYTDGASDYRSGRGGWAFVTACGIEFFESARQTTNNRMEMTAIIKAIEWLPKGKTAIILSDSEYCVHGWNSWMHKWESFGWSTKMKKKHPPKNCDLWKIMFTLFHERGNQVNVRWIKGHHGSCLNERADELAERVMRE